MLGRIGRYVRLITTALGVGLFVVGTAQGQSRVLPHYGKDTHLGVASCAGSTCHGAVEPWQQSTVLQTEYITWQRQDKHANAYKVLLNDLSKRIARNLGLESAHTAQICLDCHADNPPANLRSKQFQVSDGVGCEACHGGAMRWLGIHISGAGDHSANVAAGMYPTEDPVARAELCLSCHFGDNNKFVNHRIMGAGHPRISFELDTFTAIQPAHYVVDADYRKRKPVASGVQTWAVGQAVAISKLLGAMMDPEMGRDGIFPELVLFDCHACHHPMSNLRWEARDITGLGPGIPRINDANMLMLKIAATRVDPEAAKSLVGQIRALHQASIEGPEQTVAAAKTLKATADRLVGAFAKHAFSNEDIKALMAGVVGDGLSGVYTDYAGAEQATMALGSLIEALKNNGGISGDDFKTLNDALNKLFDAVENDEAFKPTDYRAALSDFKAAAKM